MKVRLNQCDIDARVSQLVVQMTFRGQSHNWISVNQLEPNVWASEHCCDILLTHKMCTKDIKCVIVNYIADLTREKYVYIMNEFCPR